MIAFNFGSETTSCGEFMQSPEGGLVLTAFARKSAVTNPALDATRTKQIHHTIGEFTKSRAVKHGYPVDYCLSTHETILRFAHLPGKHPGEAHAIVDLEAHQIIPVPLAQVIWDYQILGSAAQEIWSAVFVAAKSDHLKEISNAITSHHLHEGNIDVAAIALYNAFRFNYPSAPASVLLADIGARTTNLLFIEGNKLFVQSAPIGGRQITEALAKELEISFEEADTLKTHPETLPKDPTDPIHNVISALAHQTFARIYSEIAQAIDTFRTEYKGAPPTQIYLCGGTAGFTDIASYFNHKLDVPVGLFNPFQNIAFANKEIAQLVGGHEHTLGELVGTALRSLGNCPIELNLNPARVIKHVTKAQPKPYHLLAAAYAALIFIVISLYYQRVTTVIDKALAPLNLEIEKVSALAKQMDETLKVQQDLEASAKPILLAINQRNIWPNIISELANALPARFIWITGLTPLSNGEPIPFDTEQPIVSYRSKKTAAQSTPPVSAESPITALQIDGLYLENPEGAIVVDNFVSNLSRSPIFRFDGKMNSVIKQRTTPDGTRWAYPYRLVLTLK